MELHIRFDIKEQDSTVKLLFNKEHEFSLSMIDFKNLLTHLTAIDEIFTKMGIQI